VELEEVLGFIRRWGSCCDSSYSWYNDYTDLPSELQNILDDMAIGLHDAHSAPEITKMCKSLPSDFLKKITSVR
jgi:hypothetical protein